MNRATTTIIAIAVGLVAVIIIAGGVWFLMGDKTNPSIETSPSATDQNNEESEVPAALTITYNEGGFNPSTATVKSGEKVKVVNDSQKTIEFASDPHPIHTDNSELNTGDIMPGTSKTFTVTTKGEWGFHDHYDPSMNGTLTVQ